MLELHNRKGGITDIEEKATEEDLKGAGRHELKIKFVELRAAGLSLAKIAKKLHLAKSTLANWNKELEAEIAGLRAMELESLQEQYWLLKEGRLHLLGGLLERLRAEAEGRDLSGLPVDKLLELLLKVYGELKEEYVEARPLDSREMEELRDETGTKMDGEEISSSLERVLKRFRAGLITLDHAKEELVFYQAMLKARDQAEIEAKLTRIEEALEQRN
jgi:hypothetical protein